MKNTFLTLFTFGIILQIYAQTAIPPSAGDGTESNPYQIDNLENLYWIASNEMYSNKNYIQTMDINAAETKYWFGGSGWFPITDFFGVYDGNGHSIDSLYINSLYPNLFLDNFGLFGNIFSADLKNINLNNVNIISGAAFEFGALVGDCDDSHIYNCSSSGMISIFDIYDLRIGGLIGNSFNSSIENCYSTCILILKNTDSPFTHMTGGLIGENVGSEVTNCYSAGKILAVSPGGLIGYGSGSVNSCFWDMETSGVPTSSGGVGKTTAEMRDINTFLNAGWDFETVWNINSINNFGYPFLKGQTFPSVPIVTTYDAYGTSLSTAEVKGQITSVGNSEIYQHGVCWNIIGDPTVSDNKTEEGSSEGIGFFTSVMTNIYSNTLYYVRSYAYNSNGLSYGNELVFTSDSYPSAAPVGTGTELDPYAIDSLSNLIWLKDNNLSWDKYFLQTDNINAFDTKNWNGGAGWKSIGDDLNQFTGVYDGQGYVIENLYINNPDESYQGLFGIVNEADLKNIYITQADIIGLGNVGTLAGFCANSNVFNCFSTGDVEGKYYAGGLIGENSSYLETCRSGVNVKGSIIGGLVGYNRGVVSQSYSRGEVTGDDVENNKTGGLVGWNILEIKNCFSFSNVDDAGAGGLAGLNGEGSMIRNSFCYGKVSGRQSGGLVGFLEYKNSSENCFWDIETTGLDSSAAGIGLTTAQMKYLSTFTDAGWDFIGETTNGTEDIWDMDGTTNNGYPFLSWMSTTGIEENDNLQPVAFSLYQNYPNPFNPVTTIKFSIPSDQNVSLSIYNSNGQLVNELINKKMERGNHSVQFNAEKLNSGIYFYSLDSEGKSIVNKMLLIR